MPPSDFSSHFSRHRLRLGVLALLLCVVPRAPAAASAANEISYRIKAGYLFNFAKFIDWPPPPLAADDIFRVGVISDESAFEVISGILDGKKVGPNPIEVVLLRPDQDASNCRVVFMPKTTAISPAEYRAHQPNARLLLVGEKDGFAADGGDIGFVPRGDNLRYQVNLVSAKSNGLRLSARLASLAEIVQPAR